MPELVVLVLAACATTLATGLGAIPVFLPGPLSQPAPRSPSALAVEEVSGLLPLSFAFAAGAMLALIVVEMLPKAYEVRRPLQPSAGIAIGAAIMLGLSSALGVESAG